MSTFPGASEAMQTRVQRPGRHNDGQPSPTPSLWGTTGTLCTTAKWLWAVLNGVWVQALLAGLLQALQMMPRQQSLLTTQDAVAK